MQNARPATALIFPPTTHSRAAVQGSARTTNLCEGVQFRGPQRTQSHTGHTVGAFPPQPSRPRSVSLPCTPSSR
jgi:hypothetical protein